MCGPQVRAGSHRQFTLLARTLAARGIAVQRFDYRGMGDSDGAQRDFGDVELDVRAAVDHFMAAVPGMRAHLEGCPACSEEYESLRDQVMQLLIQNEWVTAEAKEQDVNPEAIEVLIHRLRKRLETSPVRCPRV